MERKLSLVVTTYNGSKYIEEELKSIKNQTVKIDEVFIMDDCSTDNTVEVVDSFIKNNELNWNLIVNKSNQGWKKNFKNGFDLCTGNYIFCADQDDIWHLDKVEKMVNALDQHEDISVLASNYHIFYTDDSPGNSVYDIQMKNDGSIENVHIDPLWCYIRRPGCTYCFRKKFYDDIKNSWRDNWPHDSQLWRYACIHDSLAIFNEPLIEYRRHTNNTTNSHKWTKVNRIENIDEYLWYHKLALELVQDENTKKEIKKGIHFLLKRKQVLEEHNFFSWLELLMFYRKYFYTRKGLLGDLFLSFK